MPAVLSEVDRLVAVAVKHPRDAFIDQPTIARQWQELRFSAPPDLERASREHDRFVEALSAAGAHGASLPRDEDTTLDSIYVRDASIVCDEGSFSAGWASRSGRTSRPRRNGRSTAATCR